MSEATKTLLLPALLRTIAPLVVQDSDDAPTRYADTTGVRLTDDGKTLEFSATDGRYFGMLTMPKAEAMREVAKFPDIDAVLPKTPAKATVRVHGDRLAQLLMAAQEAAGFEGSVILEIREPGEIIIVRADREITPREQHATFIGGLMPVRIKEE
jgi:hypothetical protein